MKNKFIKLMASFVALALIAAMCVSLASCNGETNTTSSESQSTQSVDSVESVAEKIKFTFKATLSDGTEKTQEIETDKATVGDALLEASLISGSDSEYGLMVDTVCGEKHDYNEDGTYWAFYIDGEYAMTGVSSTDVKAGSVYEFKVEH